MNRSVILVAVAAVVTFLLRAIPFWIFRGDREMPEIVKKVAAILPTAIMSVLVIYCIKTDVFAVKELIFSGNGSGSGILATGIALCSVVVLHLWKRKTLLSIAVGTMIYMALLRMI